MIRKFLLAAVATTAVAGAAQAQDAAVRWTGPYIGVHAGGSLSNDPVNTRGNLPGNAADVTANARPQEVTQDRNGPLAGGQLGYNVQFGRVVGGLEADYSLVDAIGSTVYSSPQTFGTALAGTRSYIDAKTTHLATGRARLGYLISPNWLLYATGGIATGDAKYRAVFANSAGAPQFTGFKDYDATGYAAGAGVEFATPVRLFGSSAATARLEYLHYDLGTKLVNVAAVPNVGAGAYTSKFSTKGDLLRAGLNFKF